MNKMSHNDKVWARTLVVIAAMMLCFFGLANCQELPEHPKPHTFFDKQNIANFAGDFMVRGLDATSTRMNLSNPCKCFKENFQPQVIAGSTPREFAYSFGAAGAMVGLSYLAHRTGHHTIERWIPRGDMAYDAPWAMKNFMISGQRPTPVSVSKPLSPVAFK